MKNTPFRVEANGLSFACDVEGEGDAVALCLHGFPESRYSWRHQLPVLAEAGWRAVAPDLRGYGGTTRPSERSAYRIEALTEDVAQLFDALGAKRRLLVAHDWGALIAWVFAARRMRDLDGLVIMNVPHPVAARRNLARAPSQLLKSWYMYLFQLPGLPEAMLARNGAEAIGRAFVGSAIDKAQFPDEVLEVYRANAREPGALTAMLNYYRVALWGLGGAMRDTAPIETPTLMIWGEEDIAIHIRMTEGYDDLVHDLTLHRLPQVSHWVQQEALHSVNALMRGWLDAKGLVL